MQKLVRGVHHFKSTVYEQQKELFEKLTHGQTPEVLFITCSDSRINPNLITQTDPGELFIIRNAGNFVPPYVAGLPAGGEAATIEYAVSVLGVKEIIICGHTLCGALGAMLKPECLKELPAVSSWLSHAEVTRRIMKENYSHLHDDELFAAAVEENVLNQLESLRTHPAVAVKLARQEIHLHGWVYKIETGEVFAYRPENEEFVPLEQAYPLGARRGSVRHAVEVGD